MVTQEIIRAMKEAGVKPACSGEHIIERGAVEKLLVGATISSSRKSFHYKYTSNVETYFTEGVKWVPEKKTLFVKSSVPASFIGTNGCNIRELQRIWRSKGFNIELMR